MADDTVDSYEAVEDLQETVDQASSSSASFHLTNGLDMSHDDIAAQVLLLLVMDSGFLVL